jgi:hypothetical protein
MLSSLTDRVAALRDHARQARRLAASQTVEAEKVRLTHYADELEAQAVDLERQAEEGSAS